MRRFRFIPVLLSLALLTSLVLSISGGPPAEAHDEEADDEIKTNFNLVDNSTFTPNIGPVGAETHGSGKFELDSENLDKLKFKLKIEAKDLEDNTWYYLAVTVREVVDGKFLAAGKNVPVGFAVAGMARTNGDGELEFKGKGVLPNVFESGVTEWRIDQQVRILGGADGNNCVECILVCAPTTKVELVDGNLVQVP